ncbi:dihydroxyacetone kinase subunit DhaK [Companilactobacillus sp. RD055328]|uniref:dihydroxyacetone kinase subunit DhaK n=1 Tax=Companilactobacillus sp. RD055328 TaxID=2916634 RepID=UPI001FC82FF3|nr:dihydroxyacetone kinase subunit DhaK [Companilactobacillus sp. RD055328]GKQ42356.1 dihydroxyacetone kinase subunit DhaK [Companilactobacillus sp. RD055328]
MKKIINDPSNILDEMVSGLVRSYPQYLKRLEDTFVVARNDSNKTKKVGIVSGGGSGHEPLHAGFVGQGMLDAAVCGQVFTSPTPNEVLAAIKESDQGQGVLLIVKNYAGDVMNFDIAKDLADLEDIRVEQIIVDDDISVEDSTYTQGKRGVAGTILVEKIIGAAAQNGASLDELVALGNEVIAKTNTIGLALEPATVPEVGKPGFEIADDEIEYGVGIHGEPGYKRQKLVPSKELVEELVAKLDKSFNGLENKKFAVLINGLGGTPLMEQYIFANDVLNKLEEKNVQAAFTKVGTFVTSIEMAGISLTLLELTNDEWLDNLNADAQTIGWGDTSVK